MNPLSARELACMRAQQVSSLFDTCVRMLYSESGRDRYNKPIAAYAAQAAQACGFNATAHREVMDGAQVVISDAVLRLAITATVDRRDRFKITHRHGEALAAPPTYEIIGDPARGPSGLVLLLRLVTDGSDA